MSFSVRPYEAISCSRSRSFHDGSSPRTSCKMSSMSTARPWTLRDGSTPSSPNLNWMIVSAVFRTVPSSLTFRSSRALIRRRCMYPDRDVRLEGPAGHLLELAPFVGLHEVLDLLDRGLEDVRDLLLRLFRDVLVVDAGREAADHNRADRHLRGSVDELPRGVRAVVPGQLVHDLALEGADRVLVDRAGRDHAVLDYDERVFVL